MQATKHATAMMIGLCAALTFTSCASAQDMGQSAPPEIVTQPIPRRMPETVAIGLAVAQPRLQLTLPGGGIAHSAEGIPYILPDANLIVLADSGGVRFWFDSNTPGPSSATWDIRPLSAETFILDGVRYRGILSLRLSATPVPSEENPHQSVTAVNIVGLETYLRGVVPREIGGSRPETFEAVKAQAVAARTYTVRNLGRRHTLGFDLYATPYDQVYGGASAEIAPTDSAVLATAGEVLVFGNDIVEAFYHSTCGGRTSSRADIWSGDQPYLRGVDDALGDTFACASSRYFRWTELYTGETLARFAGRAMPRGAAATTSAAPETFTIDIVSRDSSGRVRELRITRGDSSVLTRGDAIRRALPRPDGSLLRSTLFDITWETGALRINGGGWGHGLGMCQVGALGRSARGQSYRSILETYYPGTSIMKLSPAIP